MLKATINCQHCKAAISGTIEEINLCMEVHTNQFLEVTKIFKCPLCHSRNL